jgi:hypothetical protein
MGVLGTAGKHLLAVDDPLVAVSSSPGADAGQIRPTIGFGVAEAEDDLAACGPQQQIPAQVAFQPLVDRRSHHHS